MAIKITATKECGALPVLRHVPGLVPRPHRGYSLNPHNNQFGHCDHPHYTGEETDEKLCKLPKVTQFTRGGKGLCACMGICVPGKDS